MKLFDKKKDNLVKQAEEPTEKNQPIEHEGFVVKDFEDVGLEDLPDVLALVQAMQTVLSNTLEVYDKLYKSIDLQPKLEIDGELHCFFKEYKIKGSCLYLEILNANTLNSSLNLTKEQQETYIFSCFKQIQEKRLIDIMESIDYQCILKFIVSKKTKISIINRADFKINVFKLASSIVNYYIPMILTKLALLELGSVYIPKNHITDQFMLNKIESKRDNSINGALNSFLTYRTIQLKTQELKELEVLKIKKERAK